jgi:thiosulfate/3-mercaptopyruvate sulfurtransferase
MANYAHPELLVTTDWVAQRSADPKIRVVEVDVDTNAYNEGHIPGAIAWSWTTQLADTVRRDILSQEQLEVLLSDSGINNDTTVVLYGDNNNWFAAWALWQLKVYGHRDVRIVNGGRKKWIAEGRELTTDVPKYEKTSYKATPADLSLRAFLPQAQQASRERSAALARFSRLPACRKPVSVADTSPARATSHGGRPQTMTAPSSRSTN